MRPGDTARLRVLVAGPLPPPPGGMQAFYRSLLDSSLPRKVDLRFVQSSIGNRPLADSGRVTAANIVSAFGDWVRFARAVVSHRPSVTHIGSAFGLSFLKHSLCVVIARLGGSRVLFHPHCGFGVFCARRSRLWQVLARLTFHLSDGLIVLSREWLQVQSMAPNCHVYYMPNAIDLAPYQALARERMGKVRSEGALRALYLGYIGRAKGSFDLVEAAATLRSRGISIVFDLVGDDLTPGERKRLLQQASDSGLNGSVCLHPPAIGADKLECLGEADLFVYPSHSEGMPLAVMEAMACGLPVVASRVGGLPDLVQDGINGLLVEPGRPDQLAEAVTKLAVDSELRYAMQVNSYRIAAQRFDIESYVAQLVEIYRATHPGREAGAAIL